MKNKGFLIKGTVIDSSVALISESQIKRLIAWVHLHDMVEGRGERMPTFLKFIIRENPSLDIFYINDSSLFNKIVTLLEVNRDYVSEIYDTLKNECDESETIKRINEIKEAVESL